MKAHKTLSRVAIMALFAGGIIITSAPASHAAIGDDCDSPIVSFRTQNDGQGEGFITDWNNIPVDSIPPQPWDGVNVISTADSDPYLHTGAIAMDPVSKELYISIRQTSAIYRKDLYKWNSGSQTWEIVPGTTDDNAWRTNRMAVDATGTVWSIDVNGTIWSWDGASLTEHGEINSFTNDDGETVLASQARSGDLAFDSAGNMFFIMSDFERSKSYLLSIPAEELAGSDGAEATFVSNITGVQEGHFMNGLAFDSAGNLYATSYDRADNGVDEVSNLYLLNYNTGEAVLQDQRIFSVNSDPYQVTDLTSCALPVASADTTKVADLSSAQAGDTIEYTITVSNTGTAPITGATLNDPLPDGLSFTAATMNGNAIDVGDLQVGMPINGATTTNSGLIGPGDAATIVVTAVVEDPTSLTEVSNQAFYDYTGNGDPLGSDDPSTPEEDDPTVTPIGAVTTNPAIDLETDINGTNDDTSPGQSVTPGDDMTVTYTATNTGDVALTNVVLTLPDGSTVTLADLAPGESVTHVVTAPAPAAGETYDASGSVSGDDPDGASVTDEDPEYANSPAAGTPSIDVETSINGTNDDTSPGQSVTPGDDMTVTYVVTNNGDEALTNVTLTGPDGPITLPVTDLAPGESTTVDVTVPAPAAGETYDATATADGDSPDGTSVTDDDPEYATGQAAATNPAIDLETDIGGVNDDTSPGQDVTPGSDMTVTYTATNTGDVALTNVVLTLPDGSTVTLADLAPGESVTHVVTVPAPADGETYDANGSVTGDDPDGTSVNDTDPEYATGVAPTEPSIDVETSINGTNDDTSPGQDVVPGEDMTVTYVVTNNGTDPLTNVVLTLPDGTTVDMPDLAPGESATHEVTVPAPADGETYDASGSVTGDDPNGTAVTDEDPEYATGAAVATNPAIDLETDINGTNDDTSPGQSVTPGDDMTVTYTATNTGDQPLTNVVLTLPDGSTVTLADLAPGESVTHVVTVPAPADGETYDASGSVSGDDPDGASVTDEDPEYATGAEPAAPGLDIETSINGTNDDTSPGQSVTPGDDMTVTYVVTNNGNEPLTDVVLTLPDGTTVDLPDLAPGESATHEVTVPAPAAGETYDATGSATGNDPNGTAVNDSDPEYATSPEPAPAIDVETSINGTNDDTEPGQSVTPGEDMEVTYTVTNTGDQPLTDVVLTLPDGTTVDMPDLAPGESADHVVMVPAPELGEPYDANGSVTGNDPDGTAVTDEDPEYAFVPGDPSITVDKMLNGSGEPIETSLNQEVSVTFLVTNTGNTHLNDIVVMDDVLGEVACPGVTLAPGESMTCSTTMTAPAPGVPHRNVVSASGMPVDENGDPVLGEDGQPLTDRVDAGDEGNASTPESPMIDIVTLIDGNDANDQPGVNLTPDSVVEYVITNNGNVPVDDLVLTDKDGNDIPLPQTSLNPGESIKVEVPIGTLGDGVKYPAVGKVTGVYKGEQVMDDDPANGYTPVATPVIDKPTPQKPAPTKAPVKKLAHTGSESWVMLWLASLFTAAGGAVIAIGRRFRRSESR